MRAAAPGKLVLTGAYVVLEGAPAIVCAVDRYAYACAGARPTTREVEAALDPAPAVDTRALEESNVKLGLGSSAAALVAALALRAAERGEDVSSAATREAIFERAREVHARVQGGGSGVDVAASTFGGVLDYTLTAHARVTLPPGVHVTPFFSGSSARTSDLRARVDTLRARDPAEHRARFAALAEIAHAARAAVHAADARALVATVAASGPALAALGASSDAPIVPAPFAALGDIARAEDAAFIPSGAGGGDVGVFVGMHAPSASFIDRAWLEGMKPVTLALETRGVHVLME
jgi:phosphomevalonate kinase